MESKDGKVLIIIFVSFLFVIMLVNLISASFFSDIFNKIFGSKKENNYSGELGSIGVMGGNIFKEGTLEFGSFNAPWYYAGGHCSISPITISENIVPGQSISISNLNGQLCQRYFPRVQGDCVSNSNLGCNDVSGLNLIACSSIGVKIGFYYSSGGSHTLITERPITDFQTTVTVPQGANSAYVYFREISSGEYFDNNGGYKCSLFYGVYNNCAGNCNGKNCGDDGCGNSCGGPCSGNIPYCSNGVCSECNSSLTCTNPNPCLIGTCSSSRCSFNNKVCSTGLTCDSSTGNCVCVPKTCIDQDKDCNNWDNLCGSQLNCGTCSAGKMCNSTGQCICQPDCSLKVCGDSDGCSGKCNLPCNDNIKCTIDSCTLNGCSYVPKVCPKQNICDESTGSCICIPNCTQKTCGESDGCTGKCDLPCNDDNKCTIEECNPNLGCEYNLVVCPENQFCDPVNGNCKSTCTDYDQDGISIEGGACGQIDCNDSNANVNPSALESCDGIDNNCNGAIDEGCSCMTGNKRECGLSNVGRCKYGTQICSGSSWGKCDGSIEPITELCNSIDDDCDGKIDNGLSRQCGSSNKGICKIGLEKCVNGKYQDCNATLPDLERCNGLDDNCNGKIDEDCNNKNIIDISKKNDSKDRNEKPKSNEVDKTKDYTNIIIFVMILLVSLGVIVGFVIYYVKNLRH